MSDKAVQVIERLRKVYDRAVGGDRYVMINGDNYTTDWAKPGILTTTFNILRRPENLVSATVVAVDTLCLGNMLLDKIDIACLAVLSGIYHLREGNLRSISREFGIREDMVLDKDGRRQGALGIPRGIAEYGRRARWDVLGAAFVWGLITNGEFESYMLFGMIASPHIRAYYRCNRILDGTYTICDPPKEESKVPSVGALAMGPSI